MVRKFTGKLSSDDLAYLRQRHPDSYVERQIELLGVKGKADSEDAKAKAEAEAREASEKAAKEAEEAALAAQKEADEAAAKQAEEDLIGDTKTDADFDVLKATEPEVKTWVETADDKAKAAALETEQKRKDRDPRKGVVALLS